MDANPKVTVVVPTYNYGRFVCEAIDSILCQTYRDFEIVVVDDGSTDDTRERLRRYGSQIRYIHQANRGSSAARNTGIREARGEYVALLDADDTWTPNKLETQLHFAEEAGFEVMTCSMPPGPVPRYAPGKRRRRPFEDLFFYQPLVCQGGLIRRACFEKAGLFDETLQRCVDWDLLLRLGRFYPVGELQGEYFHQRDHGARMSKNAALMCRCLRTVHRRAFAWPEMRRRWLLKARVRAFYFFYASCAYFEDAGKRWLALGYLLASLAYYPFPVGLAFSHSRFGRIKRLVRLLVGERVFGVLKRIAGKKMPLRA